HIRSFSTFLDLRQKELFVSQFNKFRGVKLDFYAGFEGDSERLIACVYDEYDQIYPYEYPISILRSEINGEDKLNHRDFLGAIMNLMIKREYIGDIIVEDNVCYIACHNQMAPIIISELKKVRHSFVDFDYYYEPVVYHRKYTQQKSVTVASMRADAVVSAVLNCSRNEASTLIKQGLVSVNHLIVKRSDFEIVDNDVISIRGRGKYMLSFDGAKSRKDRFFITYYKY
ncbi:MAG: DbpA RNA binding domain-containing protein, partial [Oscillospiraceae bacterium]|nr:DbpA RNA binding domain-containing protein [Oscillospiraceae bacterium]